MMGKVLGFLNNQTGRIVRAAVGLVLMIVGLVFLKNAWGAVLALIAFVPVIAAMFDVCLIAPLFKYPIEGKKIRAKLIERPAKHRLAH